MMLGAATKLSFAENRLPDPGRALKTAYQFEIFEIAVTGPASGNPYVESHLAATFTLDARSIQVEGFYDGGTSYKIRFMPDTPGLWRYRLSGSFGVDDEGSFRCLPAKSGVHGPVKVARGHHFEYADGTPYFPFGTTCYAWTHQGEMLEAQTLASLKGSPFNKIRMCLFPKSYEYNRNEPAFYPFARPAGTPLTSPGDVSRFDPAFWVHLEQRISQLHELGIQADLILFHPYDRWGFASMSAEQDAHYLRYIVARLAAYPNVWWSMANEFDLMKSKTTAEFTRLLHLVQQLDPYQRLRSIHYSRVMYDYASPAVTHASLQTAAFEKAPEWLASWRKPIVFDEVMYEGNLDRRWGNLSGDEMTRRFWLGTVAGCYVTHGETYFPPAHSVPEDVIWWAKGGILRGTSPARVGFLRRLVESIAAKGLESVPEAYYPCAIGQSSRLCYFDYHQPGRFEVDLKGETYTAEVIDPWEMTVTRLTGTFSGKAIVSLPGKPRLALLLRRVLSGVAPANVSSGK